MFKTFLGVCTYHRCYSSLVKIFGHLYFFSLESTLLVKLDVVLFTVEDDFVAAIDLSQSGKNIDDSQPQLEPSLLLVNYYVFYVSTKPSVSDEFSFKNDTP